MDKIPPQGFKPEEGVDCAFAVHRIVVLFRFSAFCRFFCQTAELFTENRLNWRTIISFETSAKRTWWLRLCQSEHFQNFHFLSLINCFILEKFTLENLTSWQSTYTLLDCDCKHRFVQVNTKKTHRSTPTEWTGSLGTSHFGNTTVSSRRA